MTVEFTIPGVPVAKGRPRVMKNGHSYTPEKTILYENLVKTEYEIQTEGHRFPDDAQLHMSIIAFFPIPKSASKKKKEQMENLDIMPIKRPDTDNIAKGISDALNEIAYKDDSQIVMLTVAKYYANEPRVEVHIHEVGNELYQTGRSSEDG